MWESGEGLSHYRILRKLGQGGMGEVYLARDTVLERDVAIKVLPPDMASDAGARARFLREARAVATLNHAHICVVHETSEAAGTPFIVLEYIDGASLRERLASGALRLGEALRLGAEIADALEAAHAHHIVHRDLKPANVMLTGTGHAKVTDFGLARRWLAAEEAATEAPTVTELTRPGTTMGTLAYMSPEQLQGQPVDHRSDIFAFGTMLYEMVTGTHPFKKDEGLGTAAAILSEEPVPLAQRAPGVPKRLGALVARMLAKVPARRVQSMREIREALQGILLEVEPPPEVAGVVHVKQLARLLRRPRIAIPAAALVLALAALSTWFVRHQAQVRWAREEALPEIERLIGENDVWRNLIPPYRLAEQAEAIIPGDAKLNELFAQCSLKIDIKTEPPGATVSFKEYATPDAAWTVLGVTPIEQIRLPIGIFRWKFEKDGYETVLAAASTWVTSGTGSLNPYNLVRTLDKAGSVPPGMVRVQGVKAPIGMIEDFYIDRYEVTNEQYKTFVVKGGYANVAYWKHPFRHDGKELSRDEAMRLFVDQTGRPGPSTWQAGDYPEGQAGFPVSGVSWYEAAAYAEFAGTSLPTSTHWNVARGAFTPMIQVFQLGGLAVLAPFQNFGGKGPVAVGSLEGVSPYGAFDMGGNVREWCWNDTPLGRLIRGGAWDDNIYNVSRLAQAPPMDRSAENGFRCAFYPDPGKIPPSTLEATKPTVFRNYHNEQPVTDSIFQVYREQFSYDRTDLNARVVSRQERPGGWIQEKVTFDAAYSGERVIAYLFLPKHAPPPFQTVIYLPGSASLNMKSSENLEDYYEFSMFLSFLIRDGRAVLYPVYKGTFERRDPALVRIHIGAETHAYTQFLVQVVKDLRRCIDYLETRQDIDGRRLAYYGMSWGGNLGAIIPALEDRLKASVLVGGGFARPALPQADQINYVTRVKTPTLMLNGRYDTQTPYATSIKPMFDLLGTPAEHKLLRMYETDHIPPRNEFIKETLAWLEKYLGPVKR
jgi:dienelactone hydrolase